MTHTASPVATATRDMILATAGSIMIVRPATSFPCHFLGVVTRSGPDLGRATFFDVLRTRAVRRVDLDDLPASHRQWLCETGQAGALAGLILHGVHPDVGIYCWAPWQMLLGGKPILWEDERLVMLGSDDIAWEWSGIL